MIIKSPVAQAIPFDNANNTFQSTNVQDAIEEAKNTATGKARYIVSCGYGGQGKGKYFEFFKGLSSDLAPFVVAKNSTIEEITVTVSATPTGTILFYKNASLIKTITLSGLTYVETGINISFSSGDKLSVAADNLSGTSISNTIVFTSFRVE